jgi:hypothetical protein
LGPEFSERRFEHERHVALHGTVTQQSFDSAVIVIERTQTNAAALQGLILLAELDEFDFSEAASYRRRVAHAVEKWTSAVSSKVLRTTSPNTTSAVESAILAAAILGLATGARAAPDFLRAAFTVAGEEPQRAESRSQRWANIEAEARQRLPSLRAIIEAEFGESRGVRGSVRAIQADRLLPIIEDFVENWRLESADPSLAPFVRSVAPAVEEEWNLLEQRVSESLPHVDRDRSWTDQTEKVVAVLQAAFGAGRLPDSSILDELKTLATVRTNVAQKALFEARDLLAKDLPIPGKLLVVASQVPDDVAVVHRFASRAATALDAVERDLKERQASSGGATNVEVAIERVRESTARLLDAAKELAG